jgi:hypothetical protein
VRVSAALRLCIDRPLEERALDKRLAIGRLALLAHPASTTAGLVHSLHAIAARREFALSAAFGL